MEQRRELVAETHELPSRYWEPGIEDANEYILDETWIDEEIPFI